MFKDRRGHQGQEEARLARLDRPDPWDRQGLSDYQGRPDLPGRLDRQVL